MIIRLVPASDQLSREGEMLLLYDELLVRLTALGAAIVEFTTEPIKLSDLIDRLVGRFGSPPEIDVAAMTRAAVNDLKKQGVVEILDEGGHP